MSKIHIVFGPQGAGKTTYAQQLSKEVSGVLFSIDDWMWQLYGEDLPPSMNYSWIMKRVKRCEKMIQSTAEKVAHAGGNVVLDLAFTKHEKRTHFINWAQDQGFVPRLHFITASHAIRRQRVLDRNTEKGDSFSFEVTPGMFDFMEKEFQIPRKKELENAIVVDTSK